MPSRIQHDLTQEPMGIVISRGPRRPSVSCERTPAFSAYVYGPVPDEVPEPSESVGV